MTIKSSYKTMEFVIKLGSCTGYPNTNKRGCSTTLSQVNTDGHTKSKKWLTLMEEIF